LEAEGVLFDENGYVKGDSTWWRPDQGE
jgi:hypothetical protein